ncbi:hypothetical protein NXX54_22615 [Bacteroides sp. BFG-638]|nr:hypothetical protein [Bacteroides sp. BFG-638]
MKKINFQAMLKQGFLIIPKALVQQQIEDLHMQEGELEALLKILMKVNYSDTLYNDRQNKDCLCKRGESLFSYRDWSHIFHWSVGKAFRFIHELATLGIIEIIPPPQQFLPAYPCHRIRQVGGSSRQRQAEKENRQRKVPPVLE